VVRAMTFSSKAVEVDHLRVNFKPTRCIRSSTYLTSSELDQQDVVVDRSRRVVLELVRLVSLRDPLQHSRVDVRVKVSLLRVRLVRPRIGPSIAPNSQVKDDSIVLVRFSGICRDFHLARVDFERDQADSVAKNLVLHDRRVVPHVDGFYGHCGDLRMSLGDEQAGST
jgi:hypothetical protein